MDIPFSLPCTVAFGQLSDDGKILWSPPETSDVKFDTDRLAVANRTIPYSAFNRACINADKNWLYTNYALIFDTDDSSCLLNFGNTPEAIKSLPFETEYIEKSDPLDIAKKLKWHYIAIFVFALVGFIFAIAK